MDTQVKFKFVCAADEDHFVNVDNLHTEKESYLNFSVIWRLLDTEISTKKVFFSSRRETGGNIDAVVVVKSSEK